MLLSKFARVSRPALAASHQSARPLAFPVSRGLSAQADAKEQEASKSGKKASKAPATSSSFVQNAFRGIVEPEQAFPFPNVLTEDQIETLQMLIPPTEKFMEEVNDPLKNDKEGKVSDEVVQVIGKKKQYFTLRP